ncbi:MAG: hypothetical protein JNK45_32820, partial [Myxococcales bacterium]|nr:hypothetical protein [Myxococcales bacterium]
RRRFGDLPALLSALRPVRRARRWPWIAAGGLGITAVALALRLGAGPSRCDTAWPAWSSSTAATLRTTLSGVDAPDAEAVADATIDDLQRYAAAQAEVQAEVCRLREAEPLAAAVIEACVLRMRDDAEAIVAVLAAPDREVWMATATLRASLGAPLDCLDPELARRRAPVDTDPQAIARAAPIRAALAQARVELAAGRLDAAAAIVDRIAVDVDELDAPALRGEYALVHADLLHDRGDTDAAVASAYEAVAWATHAADRRTAAAAWTELVFLEGYARTDEVAARLAMRQSEAELAALGGDDAIAAERLSRISGAEFAAGRLDAAIAAATESIAAHRRRGDDLAAATVLMNLVSIEIVAVRYDDAERRLAEVEEIWRARLPAGHPDLARIPEARSRLAGERGDGAGQVSLAEQAYALRRAALGDTHPEVLTVLSYLIGTLLETGEVERALELSLRLYDGAQGQGRAVVRLNAARARAEVLRAAGHTAQARLLVDEVMRLAATELPADSPQLVDLFELRAEVALDLGDFASALADQREARRRIGAIWGDDHVYAGLGEVTIAGILLALERRD